MTMPTLPEIKKTVVAVLGVAALLASSGLLHGTAEAVVNGILAVATALGVYGVQNAPAPAPFGPLAAQDRPRHLAP